MNLQMKLMRQPHIGPYSSINIQLPYLQLQDKISLGQDEKLSLAYIKMIGGGGVTNDYMRFKVKLLHVL